MRLRPFSLALASPLETARGSIDRREGFLVAVDPGADGESVPAPGLGEATPLPGWTESRSACEAALRGAEDENDGKALATDALDRLDPTETPAARHGLALALADATARDAGQSLAERLAENENLPAPTETVPVNATIGDVDSEDTVAAAENAVEKGFDCLKVKVGARGLDADIERLRAVRRAVGGDVSLRADANGAWDRETAREAVERLAPLDLAYLEQPLPADDLDGAAALRTVGSGVDTDTDRDPPVPTRPRRVARDPRARCGPRCRRRRRRRLETDGARRAGPSAGGGETGAGGRRRAGRHHHDRRGRRAHRRGPRRRRYPRRIPLRARHRLPARHGPRSGSLPDLGRRGDGADRSRSGRRRL